MTRLFFSAKLFYTGLLVALLLLISSCESTSDKPSGKTGKTLSAQQLLSMAEDKPSPEKESLILDAAQVYLDERQIKKAKRLVNKIAAEAQPDKIFIKHTYVSAQIALAEENYHQALDILSNSRLEQQSQRLSISNEKKIT
ncbi:MAG: hypothetical protein IPK77_06770 [Cellvibrio sp.]|nr:hypothetical protein [Cellvibrio sp.]